MSRKLLLALALAAALGVTGLLASPATGATAGTITISNPGMQNSYAGDAVYLQLKATDSAPGTTLSYSLNELPDGLSLNPATGVVSGRAAIAAGLGGEGLSLVLTVTGSDGATATASFGWNVTIEFQAVPLGAVRSAYPGMCLDDKGNVTTTGNPIQLARCDGSAGQWATWNRGSLKILGQCVDDPGSTQGTPLRLAPCTGNGSHIARAGKELMFVPRGTGLGCVDAPHASAGTRLVLGTASCPPAPGKAPPAGQSWALPATPLVLALDGKCMAGGPPLGSTARFKAIQADCDGSDGQHVTLQPTGLSSPGGLAEYQLVAQNQVTCLTTQAGGTGNGTKVDWELCATATASPLNPRQLWIPKNGTVVNALSGRCLDDPAASQAFGVQPDIWSCTGRSNQRWTLPPSPVASELPGACLATAGTAPANASAVKVTRCATPQAPVPAQEWTFTRGTVRNQGKCLSVRGGSTATGSTADISPCASGDANQQWLQLAGNLLKNIHSGKCLAFPGALPAAGVSLVIKPCSSAISAGEQWHLI